MPDQQEMEDLQEQSRAGRKKPCSPALIDFPNDEVSLSLHHQN